MWLNNISRRVCAGFGERQNNISMDQVLRRFCEDEAGATAIEYGLIAALIAVAIIVAVTSLGTGLSAKFSRIAASLNSAGH